METRQPHVNVEIVTPTHPVISCGIEIERSLVRENGSARIRGGPEGIQTTAIQLDDSRQCAPFPDLKRPWTWKSKSSNTS